MATNKPIGGTGQVRVNGELFKFKAELSWNFQTHQKKGVAGRDGRVHGYLHEPVVPFVKGKFTFDGALNTRKLEAIRNGTVSASLADDRQIVLRGAFVSGEITVQHDNAEVDLTFEGEEGEEIPAPAA